jgi:hypothetical protein
MISFLLSAENPEHALRNGIEIKVMVPILIDSKL